MSGCLAIVSHTCAFVYVCVLYELMAARSFCFTDVNMAIVVVRGNAAFEYKLVFVLIFFWVHCH